MQPYQNLLANHEIQQQLFLSKATTNCNKFNRKANSHRHFERSATKRELFSPEVISRTYAISYTAAHQEISPAGRNDGTDARNTSKMTTLRNKFTLKPAAIKGCSQLITMITHIVPS